MWSSPSSLSGPSSLRKTQRSWWSLWRALTSTGRPPVSTSTRRPWRLTTNGSSWSAVSASLSSCSLLYLLRSVWSASSRRPHPCAHLGLQPCFLHWMVGFLGEQDPPKHSKSEHTITGCYWTWRTDHTDFTIPPWAVVIATIAAVYLCVACMFFVYWLTVLASPRTRRTRCRRYLSSTTTKLLHCSGHRDILSGCKEAQTTILPSLNNHFPIKTIEWAKPAVFDIMQCYFYDVGMFWRISKSCEKNFYWHRYCM